MASAEVAPLIVAAVIALPTSFGTTFQAMAPRGARTCMVTAPSVTVTTGVANDRATRATSSPKLWRTPAGVVPAE